jgi:predicted DNA-binding ArsR family transcriptional regulator
MSGGDSFRRGFNKQENERLKRRMKEQNGKMEMVEKDIKRNNLIIQGVADQEREDQLETKEKKSP